MKDEIAKLEKRLVRASKSEEEVDEYIRKLKSYSDCESLTREMCLQLINFITIGEKKADGSRDIHIYYHLINGGRLK